MFCNISQFTDICSLATLCRRPMLAVSKGCLFLLFLRPKPASAAELARFVGVRTLGKDNFYQRCYILAMQNNCKFKQLRSYRYVIIRSNSMKALSYQNIFEISVCFLQDFKFIYNIINLLKINISCGICIIPNVIGKICT